MMPNTESFQPAESSLEPGVVAWEDKPLSDEPTLLELPTDHTRSVAQSFRGARYPLAFSATVTAALKILSQRAGANLFTVVLAAFKTLLHRYTGQTDILVGVAHENRQPIGSGNTSSSSTGWLP